VTGRAMSGANCVGAVFRRVRLTHAPSRQRAVRAQCPPHVIRVSPVKLDATAISRPGAMQTRITPQRLAVVAGHGAGIAGAVRPSAGGQGHRHLRVIQREGQDKGHYASLPKTC